MNYSVLILLVSCLVGIGSAIGVKIDKNCSENANRNTLSCYTCMGRDSENCEYGLTCCSGSCFKLLDTKHDLIVKGCTKDNEEDGSMKKRTLEVPLYWANEEKVTGESYFCKTSDFCNTASLPTLVVSALAVLLPRLFL